MELEQITTYTVTLEEDENGDLILPLGEGIINQMGWDEHTILQWEDLGNGSFSLKEKK
jgi:hypothetical protein